MASEKQPAKSQILWAAHSPIPISEDVAESKFRISVDQNPIALEPEFQRKIDETWRQLKAKNPKLQDKPITFLDGMPATDGLGVTTIPTNARGYKYHETLYRTPLSDDLEDEIRKNHLMSVSALSLLLTRERLGDRKLLLRFKTNIAPVTGAKQGCYSGLGGYPNLSREGELIEYNEETFLNLPSYLHKGLEKEIGEELVKATELPQAVSLVMSNHSCVRGTCVTYVHDLNVSLEEAQKMVADSDQFRGNFRAVDFNPKAIRKFVEKVYQTGDSLSPYAVNCIASTVGAFFGIGEERATIETMCSVGIDISPRSETRYVA